MEQHFTACLRGVVDPTRPAYVQVPRRVMRAFPWGRCLRVCAELNGVRMETSIVNVGWGPSLIVPRAMRRALALDLDARVDVTLRSAND